MKRIQLTALGALALLAVGTAPLLAQGLPGATVRQGAKSGEAAAGHDARDGGQAALRERCKENPRQCAELKAKMSERREQCNADPQKCRDERKARREERCKENPQRCEQQKARFKERQELCKADPDKCRPGTDRRPAARQ